MPHRLDGKVALITGGTSGIGEATVELFVAEGARVLFTGRNADKGAEIEARLGEGARFLQADVTREAEIAASVEATVSRFGRLDALFNNAGGGTQGGPDDFTQADFEHAMSLLVGSALYGIKHAAPHMRAQGGGAIISNASIAAHRSHMGGYLYSIAKAAVVHASRMAAVQLGVDRIQVNTSSPGAIATPIFMGGSDVAAGMDAERAQAKLDMVASNLAKANALHTSGFPADIPDDGRPVGTRLLEAQHRPAARGRSRDAVF